MSMLPLYCFLPVLALTAWTDLRYMRIPNTLVLAGLAVFTLTVPFLGIEEALLRFAAGALALLICFALFAMRVLGGGDAKIIPVLLLFIPSNLIAEYLLLFSFAMVVGMAGIVLVRKVASSPQSNWASMKNERRFPMGISIALSGFLFATLGSGYL